MFHIIELLADIALVAIAREIDAVDLPWPVADCLCVVGGPALGQVQPAEGAFGGLMQEAIVRRDQGEAVRRDAREAPQGGIGDLLVDPRAEQVCAVLKSIGWLATVINSSGCVLSALQPRYSPPRIVFPGGFACHSVWLYPDIATHMVHANANFFFAFMVQFVLDRTFPHRDITNFTNAVLSPCLSRTTYTPALKPEMDMWSWPAIVSEERTLRPVMSTTSPLYLAWPGQVTANSLPGPFTHAVGVPGPLISPMPAEAQPCGFADTQILSTKQ